MRFVLIATVMMLVILAALQVKGQAELLPEQAASGAALEQLEQPHDLGDGQGLPRRAEEPPITSHRAPL